jgi:hypothetical protein
VKLNEYADVVDAEGRVVVEKPSTASVAETVPDCPPESAIFTANAKFPGVVPVPLKAPVVDEREKPGGRDDEVKVYGGVPPLAPNDADVVEPTAISVNVPPPLTSSGGIVTVME